MQQTEPIDKSTWGDGPWMTEPDRVDFQHAGYACLLLRSNRGGFFCGYVGLDRAHPYYGRPYNDCAVEVHGGLTYSEKCSGAICHVPAPGMPDDVWWLGFDLGHAGDLCPGLLARERAMGWPPIPPVTGFEEVYRTVGYARRMTRQLAVKLRRMATPCLP